jgi:ATP-dependent Clp protease ATP-binding subunit ClpC
MFERFTDKARRVVVLAQEEARILDHNYIGTEHILLGLIHEGEGVAAKALTSLGIRLEAVRQQVEEIIGHGQHSPTGHIPFTPRAKKVLELSLREALQLGHNYIGTEHILLGLIREGEGVAAQVLVRLGADLNRVRGEVIRLAQGAKGSDRPTRIATGESVRLRGPGEHWVADLLSTLARLTERIEAIEHHLGIAGAAGPEASAREPEATGKPEPVGEPEPAGKPEPVGEPEPAVKPEPAGEAKPAEDSPAASDVPDGPADPPTSPGRTVAAEES